MRHAARMSGICAALLLASCERAKDRTAEELVEKVIAGSGRQAKVVIDRQHGSITVDLGGPTVPAGWPADVPVYPKGIRVRVAEESPERQRLSLTTHDSVAALLTYYRRELPSAGWKVRDSGNDVAEIHAQKDDRTLELRCSATTSGGKSRAEIEVRGAHDRAG